jgi:hypothetical protein
VSLIPFRRWVCVVGAHHGRDATLSMAGRGGNGTWRDPSVSSSEPSVRRSGERSPDVDACRRCRPITPPVAHSPKASAVDVDRNAHVPPSPQVAAETSFQPLFGQFRLDPDIPWAAVDVGAFTANPLRRLCADDAVCEEFRRFVATMNMGLQTVAPFVVLAVLMFLSGNAIVDPVVRSSYLASGSIWIVAAVAEVALCMCWRPSSITADHRRCLRHEIIEIIGWALPLLLNRIVESLYPFECPRWHPRFQTEVRVVCRRSFRSTHATFIVLVAVFIRRPERAAVVLFLLFLADILHPALFPHEAADFAYRFALAVLFTFMMLAFSAARELRMRRDFSKLIVIASAQHKVDAQRNELQAAIRAAIPTRMLQRLILANSDLGDCAQSGASPLLRLADSSDNALVCVTEAVAFAHLATTTLLKETVETLHELFTYFDTAVPAFGLDQATTYGDRYVVTAGLIQGSRSSVVEMCRFALWQVTAVGSRLQAPLPLHSVISAGELRGGLAGSSTLRYVLDGAALENALEVLASVPTGSVYLSGLALAVDPVAIIEGFTVKAAALMSRGNDADVAPRPMGDAPMGADVLSPNQSASRSVLSANSNFRQSTPQRSCAWYVLTRARAGSDTSTNRGSIGSRRSRGVGRSPTAVRASPRTSPRGLTTGDALASAPDSPPMLAITPNPLANIPPLSQMPESPKVAGFNFTALVLGDHDEAETASSPINQLDSLLDLRDSHGNELQRTVEPMRPCNLHWFSQRFEDSADERRFLATFVPRLAADIPNLFLIQVTVWLSVILVAGIERIAHPHVSFASPKWMDAIAFPLLAVGAIVAGVCSFNFANASLCDDDNTAAHDDNEHQNIDFDTDIMPRSRDPDARHSRESSIDGTDNNAIPMVDAAKLHRRVALAQVLWFVTIVPSTAGLFLLQRNIVSYSPYYIALLLVLPTCDRMLVTHHAVLVAALAVVFLTLPMNFVSMYHVNIWEASMRVLGALVAYVVLTAYFAVAGCSNARRINFLHLHETETLARIRSNADVLDRVLGRLLPHHIADDAVAALREDLAARTRAGWGQHTTRQRLNHLMMRRVRVSLDHFLCNFVTMEVSMSVAGNALRQRQPHGGPLANDATAALLQRWEAIGRLIEEAAGGCLHHVQALGDRFTVGGPFSESDRNERIAAVGCVRLLAQLARVLDPTTDSFTAAAVVEEAFAAIVGECSLRYRCFGVAPLHSSALLDAGLAAQRYAPRPASMAFFSRRFALSVGPYICSQIHNSVLEPHVRATASTPPAPTSTPQHISPRQPPSQWFPPQDSPIAQREYGRAARSGSVDTAAATVPRRLFQPLARQIWTLASMGVRDIYPLLFAEATPP